MAAYKIYHSDGTEVCSCFPVYHGTYMQPGYLEVRSLAETQYVRIRMGDYITWRDGIRYTLRSLPNLTQNTETVIGDRLTYDNLQFHDPCWELQNALWRDLVESDNIVHFSTQKSISTYEALDGIRRRIQSCMDAQYPNSWDIKVADGLDVDGIDEAREFSLDAGSSVLDALNQIYDTWYLLGWTYSVVNGRNTVTIGGGNVKNTSNTIPNYAIGKGKGITNIKATLSNTNDLCTRIYPFGNTTNLPPRYYNKTGIYNWESVDIQNLMIPKSYWGKTGGLPDASKAYIEKTDMVSRLGVIPKVVYMDGDDFGDIYPSLEGMTIGDIRSAKIEAGDSTYYPANGIYVDNERADKLKEVTSVTDDGVTAHDKNYTISRQQRSTVNGLTITTMTLTIGSESLPIYSVNVATGSNPTFKFYSEAIARITLDSNKGFVRWPKLHVTYNNQTFEVTGRAIAVPNTTNTYDIHLGEKTTGESGTIEYNTRDWCPWDDGINLDNKQGVLKAWVSVQVEYIIETGTPEAGQGGGQGVTGALSVQNAQSLSLKIANDPRLTQDKIFLKQIGFDIADYQVKRNDYGYISFKTGKCAGRTFKIKSSVYHSDTDSWEITIKRQNDPDLKVKFPNTNYPLAAGDQYVLTGINLPDIYVGASEQRLYNRACEVLDDLSKPIFVIEPSLDSKYVNVNQALLWFRVGRWFDFNTDVFVDDFYSRLIDTVTITESEYAIPTVSITLREKKRKSFRSNSQSSSSGSATTDTTGLEEDTSATEGGGGGADITVDSEMSSTSENPVQNKVVNTAIESVRTLADNKQDKLTYSTELFRINRTTASGTSTWPVKFDTNQDSISLLLALGTYPATATVTQETNKVPTSKAVYDLFQSQSGSNVTQDDIDESINSAVNDLATVARTGRYADLLGLPDIPDMPDTEAFLTEDDLSRVAFSGDYNDLSNRPDIPEGLAVDDTITANGTNPVKGSAIHAALQGKQDSLSGAPLCHINGTPVYFAQNNAVSAGGAAYDPMKEAPILTIRHWSENGQSGHHVVISHPLIGQAGYEFVLMVHQGRNGGIYALNSSLAGRRHYKGGWAVAMGDRKITGHTVLKFTNAKVSYDDLRDFIIKRFTIWGDRTPQYLFNITYQTWLNGSISAGTERGFRKKGRSAGRKFFGIAVRKVNPAFTTMVNSSRPLSSSTQMIGGAPRYLYSPVAPLKAFFVSTDADVKDRKYLHFSV